MTQRGGCHCGRLQLAAPEADLATYTFKTGRVRHHFCPTCGCAPFGVGTDRKGEARVVLFDGRSL